MNHTSTVTLHGVLMNIFDRGCLIMAESARGKSDLALSLIDRGHTLIADDFVEIYLNENNELRGKSPSNVEKYMHIRGVGVINIQDHFSTHRPQSDSRLDLIIELEDDLPIQNDLLKLMTSTRQLLNTDIPVIQLHADSKRPLPLIVETLIREFSLQQGGKDAAHHFQKAIA